MARITLNGTMIQYPMGGMNQWVLSYLAAFKYLGHDVYFVEKAEWEYACYDPSKRTMGDDSSYGRSVINSLLARYQLENNWCFVDVNNHYYGMSPEKLKSVFHSTDIFIDLEWAAWQEETAGVPMRVFIDGEPGWFQMKLANMIDAKASIPTYNEYYTAGLNIGRAGCEVPTSGIHWKPLISPSLLDMPFEASSGNNPSITTVMNWQSNKAFEYKGNTYGQKDMEFEKFIELPTHVEPPLEVAVSGSSVPRERLTDHGWIVKDADDITITIDSYRNYIANSMAEFSVAKNAFVQTHCGWFGDRAAYYLHSGNPVVQQETGFSEHIPCGEGLHAFSTLEEATAAINSIYADYDKHSKWAREIAHEYLDAKKIVKRLASELGLP